jgi:hypothetical protein
VRADWPKQEGAGGQRKQATVRLDGMECGA